MPSRKKGGKRNKSESQSKRKKTKNAFLHDLKQWGGWLLAGLFFLHSQGMPWFEVFKWAKLWLEIQRQLVK